MTFEIFALKFALSVTCCVVVGTIIGCIVYSPTTDDNKVVDTFFLVLGICMILFPISWIMYGLSYIWS